MVDFPQTLSLAAESDRCRDQALHLLQTLTAGGIDPEAVHAIRIALRRLQAYLELLDDESHAAIVADCVSRLSRLRTLQVFLRYLEKRRARRSDVEAVRRRLERHIAKLRRKETFRKIEKRVRRYSAPLIAPSPAAFAEQLAIGRRRHADESSAHLDRAAAHPRRKTLHALRLKIKTIRYQEEWLAIDSEAQDRVRALKRAQDVLGTYEERTEFRKLARKLNLRIGSRIEKDWRRARRRARHLPAKLTVQALTDIRPMRLVGRVRPQRSRELAVPSPRTR